MATPLWQMSATQLAQLYDQLDITPTDVLEAVLARLHAVNPRLNAVIALSEDTAREAATASTRRWARQQPLSRLDGIPITVKDNIPVAGLPTSWGSAAYGATAPTGDELPIARLRMAGAVILGKTNVPEFTSQGYTDNALFGPTRNPWNTALTPGGSSGGAVACVAAGIGPIAIGTDGGGSIRRPASHTGLYGLKPSRGRVARCNGLPQILLDYEVIGPIARTVGDLAMVMDVVAAPDARDPTSNVFPTFTVPDARSCRVLYAPRFGAHPVDPEIAASTDAMARALSELGHAVTTGEAPFDVELAAKVQGIVGQAGLAWLERDFSILSIADPLREMAKIGVEMPATTLFWALDTAAGLRRRMSEFFTTFDLLLTPAAAALPWPAEQTHPQTIAGFPVGPRGHAVFTAFANITGLPGISLPSLRSAANLPIGAQLLGPVGADGLLLAIAAQVESEHPEFLGWPPL